VPIRRIVEADADIASDSAWCRRTATMPHRSAHRCLC
jgi:hypothetical protein